MTTVIPETATAPSTTTDDQRDSGLMARVEASITANGFTAPQAEALQTITASVIESGDPTGAAHRVRNLISGHYAWCKPGACEGTEHYGEPSALRLPAGEGINLPHLLSSQLYVDTEYGKTHVWVSTGNPDDDEAAFDRPLGAEFADAAQRWVDQFRAQLAQADGPAPDPVNGCTELNGQCVEHEDDHGETIHRGPEHTASGAYGDNLLTHQLVQWYDRAPQLVYVDSLNWQDLDVAATDALIADTERQLASLRESRRHLAAALAARQAAQA